MSDSSPRRIILRSMLRPFRFERHELAYLDLLVKLALLGLLYPLLDEGDLGSGIWNVCMWLVMLGSVSVCSESRRQRRIALWLFVAAILTRIAADGAPFAGIDALSYVAELLHIATAVIYIAFFALIARVMLADVFRTGRVTINRILGSICLYVVMGIGFAYAFVIVELFTEGDAFRYAESRVGTALPLSELLYFSFTSLTTLGYGDIVPRLDVARLLATVEAMVGQIYLTVLVARLVGLHIAQGADPQP